MLVRRCAVHCRQIKRALVSAGEAIWSRLSHIPGAAALLCVRRREAEVERTFDSGTGLIGTSSRGFPQLWQPSVYCAVMPPHHAHVQPLDTLPELA